MIVKDIWSDDEIRDEMWRLPFILGGIFGIISIYLRKYLSETPVFKEMQEKNELDKIPLKSVFKFHKIDSIVSMFITWVLTGCIVVLILLMPNFMPKAFSADGVELGRLTTIYMQMGAIILLCFGCFVYGRLSDKYGIAKTTLVLALLFSVLVYAYFDALYSGASFKTVLILYLLSSLLACVGPCGAPFLMIALFPNKLRFSGISFAYNIAYAIAGGVTTPFATAMVFKFDPMYLAYYMVLLGLIAAACSVWFMLNRKDINI
jgi:MFS family permease